MKIIIIALTLTFFADFAFCQSDPPHQLANKIAQKMKDSLSLSGAQKELIKNINLDLSEQKKQARGHSKDLNIARKDMQRIENKRDSMYKTVLTKGQYILYYNKKANLVTNNK
ncbi:MAG TPA: hypothetical protein VIM07_00530 [Chitinophagaceae bacterium]